MYKIFLVIAFLILLTPLFAIQADLNVTGSGSFQGTGAVPEVKTKTDSQVVLPDPLGIPKTEANPIAFLLGRIISSVLGVIGSLALVMFIYGGVIWMLSAGNQEQVTKVKNILIWATIGIVIIFTSYALVKFVLTTVTETAG